jgi:hypothetical protein
VLRRGQKLQIVVISLWGSGFENRSVNIGFVEQKVVLE